MKIHMVKKGDTLYDIANKYNVELDKLIENNPQIADPNVIEVGMKVKIPNAPKPVVPPTDYLYKHVVVQGDTLWKLGKAWNIPLHEMIEANPQLKNPNVLMTGEVVYIPKLKSPTKPHQHQHEHHGHSYNPKAQPAIPAPAVPSPVIETPEANANNENVQPIAQLPTIPEKTQMPEVANKAQMPEVANMMQMPEVANKAQMPEVAHMMQMPEVANKAQMPEVANMMQMPEVVNKMPMPEVANMMQMPEVNTKMQMHEAPHMDLFQQFQVPATEVFSFDYESWTMPAQPSHQEMPAADNMPFNAYPEASTMPAYYMPPQQPSFNDCGCGGPAFPSYPQAMPYSFSPFSEFPMAEHPSLVNASQHYPQAPFPNMMMPGMEAPYPNMMMPGMEAPYPNMMMPEMEAHYPNMMMPGMEAPCFHTPYDAFAMTNAFPGPGFPSQGFPAYPTYESPFGTAGTPFGTANVKTHCNCGCHDRANISVEPAQRIETPTIVSSNEEKAKVKSAKASKRAGTSTEASIRKLAQKKRRSSSNKVRSQQSPWINV
ncbi:MULTISPECIES: LysM peptidoglycan-binding domain-containing protein [unclassified Paenibacillus]|uniref:LysM peptidoglycan-binding domain-containing protein n=1 Tax=unclassified Paenibacillus TaxID=185978 RepID=UPI0036323C0F